MSSKPTQTQGLCRLICCAICQHKKLLLRKKYKKKRKESDRSAHGHSDIRGFA